MKKLDELIADPDSRDISFLVSGTVISRSTLNTILGLQDFDITNNSSWESSVEYGKRVMEKLGNRAYTTSVYYSELLKNFDEVGSRLDRAQAQRKANIGPLKHYGEILTSIKDLLMNALENVHRISLPQYVKPNHGFSRIVRLGKIRQEEPAGYNKILGYLIENTGKHFVVSEETDDLLEFFAGALYLSSNLPQTANIQIFIQIFTHISPIVQQFGNLIDRLKAGNVDFGEVGLKNLNRLNLFTDKDPIKIYSLDGDNSSQITALYPIKNETTAQTTHP